MNTKSSWFFVATTLAAITSPVFASPGNEPAPVQPDSQTTVLHVPGMVTPAGKAFAKQCNDKAFAAVEHTTRLANRCEKLLKDWRLEAYLRSNQLPGAVPRASSPVPLGANLGNSYAGEGSGARVKAR